VLDLDARLEVELLVGREGELGRIAESIDSARSGRGSFVVVEGPAGIGKSALLAHAADRGVGSGCCVLRAAGGPLEREYTFGVVRQLFAGVVAEGRSSGLLIGAAELAATPLGLPTTNVLAGDLSADVSAAMHGLYWLAVNLAERQPLMLVIDDAQWADLLSLRFVLYLARRVEGMPVLVLVATHPVQERTQAEMIAQFGSVPELVLMRPAALSEPEVGYVIANRGLTGAHAGFVHACCRASGGNPFLLGELLTALVAEGATGHGDEVRIAGFAPESIVRWVLARLAAQGEAATQLAFALAVLGPGATLSDIAQLAGVERDAGAVAADRLIGASIVSPQAPLGFAHPLVAAAV
jgi:predicted ATPase